VRYSPIKDTIKIFRPYPHTFVAELMKIQIIEAFYNSFKIDSIQPTVQINGDMWIIGVQINEGLTHNSN